MTLNLTRTLSLLLLSAGANLHAGSITFGLLDDPGQNYTFARSDSTGQNVTDPVGPYPGFLGADVAGDLFGFFCIDYLKAANWNTDYTGTEYHIGDAIPGKSMEQQLEAAYLSAQLYGLGGSGASTTLYQGPISFAIWQIMDPTPGDVPVDPAAQYWIAQAVDMYNNGLLNPAEFANTLIFVPDNSSVQDFLTLSQEVPTPEPQTVILSATGTLLILLGKLRLRRR